MQAYAKTIQKEWKKVSLTAKHFNKDLVTTRKYLNMSAEEIQTLDNITKHKEYSRTVGAASYLNMIYKMIQDGYSSEVIYYYVISKGYLGTPNALQHAIAYLARNNFGIILGKMRFTQNYSKGSIVITRNDLLKEITARSPSYKHNKIIQANLNLIIEKYPIVKTAMEIFGMFHSAIMGDKLERLDEFIKKYETKKEKDETGKDKITYQSPISSFIEGLKKDITPAENAISFSESSGFVEGNNCKFKLVKRILYGRADLVNLFRKCYLCFSFKKVNFSLKGIYSLAKEKCYYF